MRSNASGLPARAAEQRQGVDPAGAARRRLQRRQPAHRVTDQRRGLDPGRRHQPVDPVGQIADAGQHGAAAAAVAGQVGGQHRAAVIGEVAGLQRPHRVVQPGAVQEDDRRPVRVDTAVAWRRGNVDSAHVLAGAQVCERARRATGSRVPRTNAEADGKHLEAVAEPDAEGRRLLADATERLGYRPAAITG